MYSAVTKHRETVSHEADLCGWRRKSGGACMAWVLRVDEMIQGFGCYQNGRNQTWLDDTVAIHPTGSEEFVTMR